MSTSKSSSQSSNPDPSPIPGPQSAPPSQSAQQPSPDSPSAPNSSPAPQQPITQAIRIRTGRTAEREHSSPLFLTSSFCFDDAEQMRAAFADETDDNIYSRFSNPSVQEFIDRMCALEGAE
ncbi:MAG TPA: PLP-dependent transferase, partial [Puia sp.]|nr:PLP-dependent transferase [Puia sp.]